MRGVVFLCGAVSLVALGCGDMGLDGAGGGFNGSVGTGGPTDPPPTGNKWEGVEVVGECGRKSLAYVLVDEVCGGVDDPNYMDYFQAPIMRDGVKIGSDVYAVDASHLWVLDATDPQALARLALSAGFGEPMAVAQHEGRLLIAAGREGLLVVDVSIPEAPMRLHDVDLAGPALDVSVDGDTAYVSMGKAGIAVIDLAASPPTIQKILDVQGFAAATKVRDGIAYVAACESFAVLDVASGSVLGKTWVADAKTGQGILVAPAKDVALDGATAYVAAGRFGAVSVDITDPQQPAVKGNCTLPDEHGFYASGLHVDGERLFVAAGEWGILPVDVAAPACTSYVQPILNNLPPDDVACSTEPPWEVLSWQETWLPPVQPGRDPLQVITDGDQLYAFGDATRIGIRAIDVRTKTTDELPKVGRYEEPRMLLGVAGDTARVVAFGKAGAIFTREIDGSLTQSPDVPEVRLARAAAFLGDGRYVLGLPNAGGGTDLIVEGEASPIVLDEPMWPGSLAARDGLVFVPEKSGVLQIDVATGTKQKWPSQRVAELPQSIVASPSSVLVAAPEWPSLLRITQTSVDPLAPQGVWSVDEIENVSLWRSGLPRRLLAETSVGVVEVAGLGIKSGLTVHPTNGSETTIDLPRGTYMGIASSGDRVYLVATDRGRYTSTLVTVNVAGSTPSIEGRRLFTGDASGVALIGASLYLADADRGVVVYDVAGGSPVQKSLIELEVLP